MEKQKRLQELFERNGLLFCKQEYEHENFRIFRYALALEAAEKGLKQNLDVFETSVLQTCPNGTFLIDRDTPVRGRTPVEIADDLMSWNSNYYSVLRARRHVGLQMFNAIEHMP